MMLWLNLNVMTKLHFNVIILFQIKITVKVLEIKVALLFKLVQDLILPIVSSVIVMKNVSNVLELNHMYLLTKSAAYKLVKLILQ